GGLPRGEVDEHVKGIRAARKIAHSLDAQGANAGQQANVHAQRRVLGQYAAGNDLQILFTLHDGLHQGFAHPPSHSGYRYCCHLSTQLLCGNAIIATLQMTCRPCLVWGKLGSRLASRKSLQISLICQKKTTAELHWYDERNERQPGLGR